MDQSQPLPPVPISLLQTRLGPGVTLLQHLDMLRAGLEPYAFQTHRAPDPPKLTPNQGGIHVTPRELIVDHGIKEILQDKLKLIHQYLGDARILPLYPYPEFVDRRISNEAGVHDLTVIHSLAGTMHILEAIRSMAQRPNLDAARRDHPLIRLFKDVERFSFQSGVQQPGSWKPPAMTPAQVGRVLNRGRANADSVPSSTLSDEAIKTITKELNKSFGATQPDLEIIATTRYEHAEGWTDTTDKSVLTIELKRQSNLNPKIVNAAVQPESWYHSTHAAKVRQGRLPVREAYAHRLIAEEEVFDNSTDGFNQWTSQEWKYMIQRAHQWGVTSSAVSLVPIKLDRQADRLQTSQDANITTIDGDWSFELFRPTHYLAAGRPPRHHPINAEIYAVLTMLNMEAGPAREDSYAEVARQVHTAIRPYLPNNQVFGAGPSQATEPANTSTNDSPLRQLRSSTSRNAAPPSSDTALEADIRQLLLPAPAGFAHPFSYRLRRQIIHWGIHRRSNRGRIDPFATVRKLVQPYPILNCLYIPMEDVEDHEERQSEQKLYLAPTQEDDAALTRP
ncbi:hypothetical protein PSEUBRA_004262 [Kalmanozyma brasiliensis GHG001]|uniref:uncharacterized protein n=1 Tax=Kalmanozyma brasiliensis (strain GHG001) TaxID=1365824 RepID=UPI002867FF41|nr:uncharacterized protein PSEUBRA_004262 [Kalmanozyma brasiliensis GHG001]KAF6767361.1 hypothetical protein PSEUBRA_004262 [Kalmanozyma brasiliensis GHG001]